jgi:hypothetical protein
MASPSLNPSGFLQFEDDGCEMNRDRSQPSRESHGITQLNEIVEKYGNTQYKGGDFLELASIIKWMSRSWNRLAPFAKRDFIKLIMESNSQMSKDIISEYTSKQNNKNENFGDIKTVSTAEISNDEEAIDKLTKVIDSMKAANPELNIKVIKCNNSMSIFSITMIAIVAIIIGYLIAFAV